MINTCDELGADSKNRPEFLARAKKQILITYPSGALTVEFHADEAVTGTGWSAIVSCLGWVNINENVNTNKIEI